MSINPEAKVGLAHSHIELGIKYKLNKNFLDLLFALKLSSIFFLCIFLVPNHCINLNSS